MNSLFVRDGISTRDLHLSVSTDRELICRLINQWHSWRSAPCGWKVAFVLTDGIAIYGVSIFGRPVARCEDQETTLEHTRMALSRHAPRNSATYFMAQSRKWIRENMPHIKRLISYVPAGTYTGITYRGDNWRTVYANKKSTSKWTNRARRHDVQNEYRTKFEREP